MPRCRRCDGEFAPEELVRHVHRRLEIVHCPDCGTVLGTYRRHGDAPATDRRAEGDDGTDGGSGTDAPR